LELEQTPQATSELEQTPQVAWELEQIHVWTREFDVRIEERVWHPEASPSLMATQTQPNEDARMKELQTHGQIL
jgi:hypothetical protein